MTMLSYHRASGRGAKATQQGLLGTIKGLGLLRPSWEDLAPLVKALMACMIEAPLVLCDIILY